MGDLAWEILPEPMVPWSNEPLEGAGPKSKAVGTMLALGWYYVGTRLVLCWHSVGTMLALGWP